MGTKKGEFFIQANSIEGITDLDYRDISLIVEAAKAFERITYQSVYIIDYKINGFLYVSESLTNLTGIPKDRIIESGYNFYINYVPESDLNMLYEINRNGFGQLNRIPENERKEYTISYDFHIRSGNGRRAKLINHKTTPILLTRDGRIWLALCTISLSSAKKAGQIILKKPYNTDYYEYSLERHKWEYKQGIRLTDTEKEVLRLSTQGLTMEGIADRLCKSVDTIKACKRNLFAKLGGVKNIAEALIFAENHKLL